MGEFQYLTINGTTYTVADPDAAMIRDDRIGPEAWSAQNIVERLCPAFDRTGETVIGWPVADYPLAVTSRITAAQAGSGDASPENIRPITGITQAVLSQTAPDGDRQFSVSLGRTVYGGSYRWDTGRLEITTVCLTFDGTENWFLNFTGQLYSYHQVQNCANWGEITCSHFIGSKDGAYNRQNGHVSAGSALLWFCDQRFTTLESFKSYLQAQAAAGTPVQVVLTLTVPVTVDLTAQAILGLAGENTWTSSCGATEVRGKADPAALLEELTQAVAALGGTI